MNSTIGLYFHIPFCRSKCAYCDFFSGKADEADYDRYTSELKKKTEYWGASADEIISSVYFGGGTPSVLGTDRLIDILQCAKQSFSIRENAEITLEVNPESGLKLDFHRLKSAGFNRISIGMQSSDERELKTLGRIHSPSDAKKTVEKAKKGGFENISLDLMMGIPHQTKESLKRSIDFCAECGVTHISSYIMKVEQGTRFYSIKEQLQLPDEDEQASLYLFAVDYLDKLGFNQYEISNFSKTGFESRHNTLYWKCGEYIGIGPSAHSFYHGKRFYYERDIQSFFDGKITDDGTGGDESEYIMLALRLRSGLDFAEYEKRFGCPLPQSTYTKIQKYARAGFMECDSKRACFTPRGFLVSNAILSDIL